MKTIALGVVLLLHATGLWSHAPATFRTNLTRAAADPARVTAPASPAADPFLSSNPAALPVQTGARALSLPVGGAYAVDVASGTVLYSQNPSARRPIASLSKLTTALVILSRHSLTDTMTVPTLPSYQPEDERIGLVAGEKYQVQDLLRAMLINSANDAADALAIADAGSIPKFAARMNAKLSDWGIGGTRFVSPSGLVDTGNYSTAEALSQIARLALTNAFFRQTVSQSSATITSSSSSSSSSGRVLNLQTTDDLLAGGEFYGIKTGYTLAAGECFVGLTRINDHEVITVVLGADDRFANTQTLVNWISQNWTWL